MTDASIRAPPFLAKLGEQTASHDETGYPSTQTGPIYVPPLNFAAVSTNVYRSGFPRPENYCFLESLGLRSILSVAVLWRIVDLSNAQRIYHKILIRSGLQGRHLAMGKTAGSENTAFPVSNLRPRL